MTEDTGDANVREMRLRYAGRCRLCGAELQAGTLAVHERSRRTVRCIECTESTARTDGDTSPGDGPVGPVSVARNAVVATEPFTADRADAPDNLRLRAPASAVITELLRIQSSAPPRSASARLFGRTPLTEESQSWFRGAIGELEVGRLLDRLDDSWFVIHAVPIGTAGSDIDHLVIGPGGVFTINTKHHAGMKIWVASRRLLVSGQRTDHLRNAAFEAKRVAKVFARATGVPIEVTPIVAIVAARSITVRERPADVVVLTSDQLVRWLQRRLKVVGADRAAQLAEAALNPSTWGDLSVPAADLVAFATLRASVDSARARRRMWALLALLSPMAVIAASVLALSR
ncbi:nuclease-related domain-containing protein [uncultured Microbacterium sp.]|uniref:nuclease-related domain-containing protein n=1 Tax=uncultured Microbacterium sp. TaxID=191216 RepID=UPI0028D2F76F|nr:nuclease-related domain-containing protein [uncultured Microbacterium sp.]